MAATSTARTFPLRIFRSPKLNAFRREVSFPSGDTPNAIAAASIGDSFIAILKADQQRDFPLLFRRGELLEKECKEVMPFVVICFFWARNSSHWSPEFEGHLFISKDDAGVKAGEIEYQCAPVLSLLLSPSLRGHAPASEGIDGRFLSHPDR